MTLRQYISDKLRAFGVGESVFADITLEHRIDPDLDIVDFTPAELGAILIGALEQVILMPRLNSVNEGGFSMSWDTKTAAKYYQWLCRKWSVIPNNEVLALMGFSTISDASSRW